MRAVGGGVRDARAPRERGPPNGARLSGGAAVHLPRGPLRPLDGGGDGVAGGGGRQVLPPHPRHGPRLLLHLRAPGSARASEEIRGQGPAGAVCVDGQRRCRHAARGCDHQGVLRYRRGGRARRGETLLFPSALRTRERRPTRARRAHHHPLRALRRREGNQRVRRRPQLDPPEGVPLPGPPIPPQVFRRRLRARRPRTPPHPRAPCLPA
mmetsp:Transcript_24127/g.57519  ORF Transcript_24127/g.57519 Transcript_24127/m.57519 type:complete len:210 (-) Transcript_24127:11-640(-)